MFGISVLTVGAVDLHVDLLSLLRQMKGNRKRLRGNGVMKEMGPKLNPVDFCPQNTGMKASSSEASRDCCGRKLV